MPGLVLGPLLRYTGSTQATVWVETDAPCEVAVLDARERTFCVEGHHYALVVLEDLDEGSVSAVRGASRRRARLAPGRRPSAVDDPHARARAPRPPRLRLLPRRRSAARRRTRWHAPSTRTDSASTRSGRSHAGCKQGTRSGPTACSCWATRSTPTRSRTRRARSSARGATRAAARRAGRRLRGVHPALPRGLERPRHPLAARDRAEHDDLRRPRRARRLEHLGGVDTRDARDVVVGRAHHRRLHVVLALPAPRQPRAARAGRGAACSRSSRTTDDGGPRLREFARAADREPAASRFAFHRDFGRSRLVVIDSRAARVLADGRRDMVDDGGVAVDRRARARRLRPPDHREHAAGLHDARASTASRPGTRRSARAPGAASPRALGEKLRRALDLEHWPAFQRSFTTMIELLHELAEGPDAAGDDLVHRRRRAHRVRGRGRARRRGRRAASSRSSARRSATRCGRASGEWSALFSTRAAGVVCRALARSARVPRARRELAAGVAGDVRQLGRGARAGRAPRAR